MDTQAGPETTPEDAMTATNPRQGYTHAPCPDHEGQWFHKSTGDCSCGGRHSMIVRGVYRPHELLRDIALGLGQVDRPYLGVNVTFDAPDNWTVEAEVWVTRPDGSRHRMLVSVTDTPESEDRR